MSEIVALNKQQAVREQRSFFQCTDCECSRFKVVLYSRHPKTLLECINCDAIYDIRQAADFMEEDDERP